jgi:hypothetical protein
MTASGDIRLEQTCRSGLIQIKEITRPKPEHWLQLQQMFFAIRRAGC